MVCLFVRKRAHTKYSLLENISTGLPFQGHPLNCQAGPMTKTATTLSQSACVSFPGLSITLYGTVRPPSFLRWSSSSLLLFSPEFFLSSVVTNLKTQKPLYLMNTSSGLHKKGLPNCMHNINIYTIYNSLSVLLNDYYIQLASKDLVAKMQHQVNEGFLLSGRLLAS